MIVPKVSQLPVFHEEIELIPFKELLKGFKKEERKYLRNFKVWIHKHEVHTTFSKARNGGERYWFECPSCKRRCIALYYIKNAKKLGCRKCLKLQYPPAYKKDGLWSKFFSYCRKSTS